MYHLNRKKFVVCLGQTKVITLALLSLCLWPGHAFAHKSHAGHGRSVRIISAGGGAPYRGYAIAPQVSWQRPNFSWPSYKVWQSSGSVAQYNNTAHESMPSPHVIDVINGSYNRSYVGVSLPNDSGGYRQVELQRVSDGYLGPQGEVYHQIPSISQLKQRYE